jgi:3-oxoadipate enol-lactonase
MAMPTLQLSDDLLIHFNDIPNPGSPTVVLLHGLGVNNESWGMQAPVLAGAGFRVLIPDLRGFGRSTYPGGRLSIRDMAGDVVSLLTSLEIPAATIAGISMGGTVALQLAIDRPDLVSRLILINTFARLRPMQLRTWLYFASRFFLAHIIGVRTQARTVAKHLFPRPQDAALRELFVEQISQADPAGYRAAMRALARFDVSRRLAEISVPTLVITGDQDTTVPREIQQALATHIPGACHEIISGAGHAATVEKPEQINRLLINFIREIS